MSLTLRPGSKLGPPGAVIASGTADPPPPDDQQDEAQQDEGRAWTGEPAGTRLLMAAADGAGRRVWLAWRRSGNGYPAVYHPSEYCATRRSAHQPRQMAERSARKVARICATCQQADS